MKVKHILKILKNVDENLEVRIDDDQNGWHEVEKIEIKLDESDIK